MSRLERGDEMPNLSARQRDSILNAIDHKVTHKFYDPRLNGIPWNERVTEARASILQNATNEEFEAKNQRFVAST
jgi:hypothetical protein